MRGERVPELGVRPELMIEHVAKDGIHDCKSIVVQTSSPFPRE